MQPEEPGLKALRSHPLDSLASSPNHTPRASATLDKPDIGAFCSHLCIYQGIICDRRGGLRQVSLRDVNGTRPGHAPRLTLLALGQLVRGGLW